MQINQLIASIEEQILEVNTIFEIGKLKNGDKIKITWLPSCKNAPYSKNAYIGMQGVVEDLKEDKSFTLRTETAVLIVGKKYKFENL